jgi:hypothetical protein
MAQQSAIAPATTIRLCKGQAALAGVDLAAGRPGDARTFRRPSACQESAARTRDKPVRGSR